MKPVSLAKTTVVTVQSAQITGLVATLDDGTTIPVTGPVSVGDWATEDTTGALSVLTAKHYAAELAGAASLTAATSSTTSAVIAGSGSSASGTGTGAPAA